MSVPDGRPESSLGERVQLARTRAFVGRQDQIAPIVAALREHDGRSTTPSVFYVHGPGGIGKSTLLRRVAALAGDLGHAVVELDGRFDGRSTHAFRAAAEPVTREARAVLVIDAFEHCQWLETWLRDGFLPRLREGVVVVLASRERPDVEWTLDPVRAGVLRVVALEALDEEQSAELLQAVGVAPDLQAALIRFAGGNPLALSLAAAVAIDQPAAPASWTPSGQVLGTLLGRLVGDLPTAAHRRALEAAAQALTITEDLLRVALAQQDTGELFAWLRGLPYMESGTHGLYPHDAVREALTADLRWRDPRTFEAMRRRLADELLRQVEEASESDALAPMGALRYLYRDTPPLGSFYAWTRQGQVEDEQLRREDLPTALAMAEAAEGAESAALVRYWFDRQPRAFRLYRSIDTGETVAFSAQLDLPAPPDPADLATDPVVAAAWQHCRASAPVSAGEHITLIRFAVDPADYQRPSPVMNLIHWRALVKTFTVPNPAYGFLVYRDADFWRQRLAGRMLDTGARPMVGGRSFALFAKDWRRTPPKRWIHLNGEAHGDPPSSDPGDGRISLSRDDFDVAVRQALLLHRHPDGLNGSPLARTTLVPAGSPDADAALRAVLRQALSALRADPRRLRGHDAVVATRLDGVATQRAAARRLGVPFGTYRRHLRQGVQDLCDQLWLLYTADSRSGPAPRRAEVTRAGGGHK